MRCADGKQSFLSPRPHMGHGHSIATTARSKLCTQPQRIHASPCDGHRAFQHSVSMEQKKKKSAKSPRGSDQDISVLVLLGRGESSGSPSQSTMQPVGLHTGTCTTVLWDVIPAPSLTPGASSGPMPCPCDAGYVHGQHPCCWCHRPAGGPGAGANPSQLAEKCWPSKANLKPELSSWPPVWSPGGSFLGTKKQSQKPKNNPELLQQGGCILRYAEYYQRQRPPAKAGEGMKAL